MTKKKGLVISRQIGSARAFDAWMKEAGTLEYFDLDVYNTGSFFTPAGKYDFLLSGTSLQREEDALFFQWARSQGIPSFAFVDQWVNYAERFCEEALPSHIILVDERARAELAGEISTGANLIVAGSPALHYTENFWQLHNRKKSQNLIYFATEPSTPEYQRRHGINDLDQLNYLVEALRNFPQFQLRVLLHPSDHAARLADHRALITTDSKVTAFENASFITGMRSMILLESWLLGLPTISLQIGRKTPSGLTDNRNGLQVVTQPENIVFAQNKFTPDHSLRENTWTENILKLL